VQVCAIVFEKDRAEEELKNVQETKRTFNAFKCSKKFNAFKERSIGSMGSNVQNQKINYFLETKLLHTTRLRSERRCGSRRRRSSNRAKARSESSSAVTSATQ